MLGHPWSESARGDSGRRPAIALGEESFVRATMDLALIVLISESAAHALGDF